ncbi:MAG: maltose transport system substrate-binding protein [Chloroflexota bacterium]|nr:maltose transport system substrate-binding protein [Chloroflexota bacterium]
MTKKLFLLLSVLLIAAISITACSTASTAAPADSGAQAPAADTGSDTTMASGGEVYYLNFKPEVSEIYDQIAKAYKDETGVTLKVVTAAAGTYEQTLKSEIAKSDAPVLFQINGPRGYANWADYCADLKDTELYQHLSDKSLAVTVDGGVYGIPYVVEGYGIIYNNAIMDQYFAMDGAKAASMDEINNFATLQAVVEDMTAKKDALGIKGVFSSTSLKPGEDWRWQTHLANVPIFYEIRDNNLDIKNPDDFLTIKFQYSDNFKNIFDLYLNNSTTEPTLLGSKSVDDSMAEFALGQSAMVQNGNWAWGQISGVDGNVVKAEDVKFLPIYTGMPGEENQSISVGTENFFAINSQASPEKQKLAADFIYWLYSSDTGKAFVTNDLKFIAPFDTFTEEEKPTDPLAKSLLTYMANPDLYNVAWDFVVFPSQTFKDNFGGALLQYAQGSMTWPDVKQLMVDQWAIEAAK